MPQPLLSAGAAPYNPETLALMRREAARGAFTVALMLGWSADRVISIARKHGIEIVGIANPFAAPQAVSPPLAPESTPTLPTRFDASYDAETGVVVTPRGKARLSERQSQLFGCLWVSRQKLSGSVIAATIGVTVYNVSAISATLNGKLLRIGLKIETARGKRAGGGGYWLASENGVSLP